MTCLNFFLTLCELSILYFIIFSLFDILDIHRESKMTSLASGLRADGSSSDWVINCDCVSPSPDCLEADLEDLFLPLRSLLVLELESLGCAGVT